MVDILAIEKKCFKLNQIIGPIIFQQCDSNEIFNLMYREKSKFRRVKTGTTFNVDLVICNVIEH